MNKKSKLIELNEGKWKEIGGMRPVDDDLFLSAAPYFVHVFAFVLALLSPLCINTDPEIVFIHIHLMRQKQRPIDT